MRSVGTLTRADLAETINRKMGFSRAESLDMVEAILGKMSDALARGENVKISGFGSFVLRDKNESQDRGGSADHAAPGDDFPCEPAAQGTHRQGLRIKGVRADGRVR